MSSQGQPRVLRAFVGSFIHSFNKHFLGLFSVPGIVLGPGILSSNGGDRHMTRQVQDRVSRLVAGGTQWLWEALMRSGRASWRKRYIN